VQWLVGIAAAAARPLILIVRGGIYALPQLTTAFNRVSILETWSFMKTMKRQRAIPHETGGLRWRRAPTPIGAPLDTLFAANRAAVARWIEGQTTASAASAVPMKMAAGQ
jgi:hypothetical protein